MLRVQSLWKSYGDEPVLTDVSFVLPPGRRAGLVGPNGSGKSTLLRIVAGEIPPDRGSVWVDPASSIAYLPQFPEDELHLTVRESLRRGAGAVTEARDRVARLEESLTSASGDHLNRLLAEYADARDRFERLDGYTLEARIEEVVDGLAIDAVSLESTVHTLSGGNRTKLSLARLLLSGSDILLLDEPTNYLDLPALLWLERFVSAGNRTYLIVSHDRRFLDRTVDTILQIDPAQHSLRQWAGNYSTFDEARRQEEQKQLEAYRDQQAEIRRVEEDIRLTKEQARGVETRMISGMCADVQRRYAKKVAKKAKARERRLERRLEANTVEKPRPDWGLHLADLGGGPVAAARTILDIRNLSAGYGDGEILHGIDLLVRGRDRLALLGENGSGKTTLLRCITGSLPHSGEIRVGPSVRLGVLSQETDDLPLDDAVLDVFRSRSEMYEDEARTYLHRFLFRGDEVFKPVRALSYGQRAKLALAMLILSGATFLLLDEPTSHMDMPALEAIEQALGAYAGPLLVVSHDRYFLERIGITGVMIMDGGRIRRTESMAMYEEQLAVASR